MKKVYIDEDGKLFEGLEAEVVEQVEDNLAKHGYFEAVERETKGGNIMERLFVKSDRTRVVKFKKEDGKIKRKARVIGAIASESVKATFENPATYLSSGMVGLQQGLKYKGDFKAGGKAAVATAAVLAGIDIAANMIAHKDNIKKA